MTERIEVSVFDTKPYDRLYLLQADSNIGSIGSFTSFDWGRYGIGGTWIGLLYLRE